MENLTKHQLVLLTLLVSFITSIGTGIITFTLLSEAPVEITQTINRVVEKTIEKVVTEEGKPEKIVTTVVVNEEDRVIDAISKNEKSIVRLKSINGDGLTTTYGIGLVINEKGILVYSLENYDPTITYDIVFFDGKTYPVGKAFIDKENNLVFIETSVPKNDNSGYKFYPALLGDSDNLKIGQTLVSISELKSNAISIGRVRQIEFGDDKKTVQNIISDIPMIGKYAGGPVLNLSGEIIGIERKQPIDSLQSESLRYAYIPINIIKKSLPNTAKELGF